MGTNILFVNLPSLPLDHIEKLFDNSSDQVNTLAMPLGILYLSAHLKKQVPLGRVAMMDYPLELADCAGYQGTVRDFIGQRTLAKVDFQPDLVAVSLMFSASHQFFALMLEVIREIWPGALVMVGGIHATNTAQFLLSNYPVDYVVRGEGELAMLALVQQIQQGGSGNIPGVYPKERPDADLGLGQPMANLDDLPFPDWDLLDMEQYIYAQGRRRALDDSFQKPMAAMMTTRGCPHKCTYCSAHTVHGRKVRYRSQENILAEIKELHRRFGISLIIPEDDFFTANRRRVLALLKSLPSLGIPGLEIQCSNALNVNSLTFELLDAMVDCGTKVINLAVESGSEYVQKHIMKKNVDLEKARQIVKYCRQKGLIVRCTTVIGMPRETKDLLEETYRYMKDIGTDWCIVQIFIPLVGSEAYQELVEMGHIKPNDLGLWAHAFFQSRNFDTPDIPAAYITDFANRMNYDINFINNVNLREGKYARAVSIFTDIIRLYPFHLFGWYGLYRALQGLGEDTAGQQALATLRDKAANDPRSQAMFKNYGYLLPQGIVAG